jgi:hypothetical protein
MGRPKGSYTGMSDRTKDAHKNIIDRYFELVEKTREMYKKNGMAFTNLSSSYYSRIIAEEKQYAYDTVRLIIAEHCNHSNKTIRQLHKECLSLKKTSGVTVS